MDADRLNFTPPGMPIGPMLLLPGSIFTTGTCHIGCCFHTTRTRGVCCRLHIPGAELGCGQRDGRRAQGEWPDLLQQRGAGWSALQREQARPPHSPRNLRAISARAPRDLPGGARAGASPDNLRTASLSMALLSMTSKPRSTADRFSIFPN